MNENDVAITPDGAWIEVGGGRIEAICTEGGPLLVITGEIDFSKLD